jgi:hypothetical protein
LHQEQVGVPDRCPYSIAQVLEPDYFLRIAEKSGH